jgi:hypothetical protein
MIVTRERNFAQVQGKKEKGIDQNSLNMEIGKGP